MAGVCSVSTGRGGRSLRWNGCLRVEDTRCLGRQIQERAWLELCLGAHGSRGEESVDVAVERRLPVFIQPGRSGCEIMPAFPLCHGGHDTFSFPTKEGIYLYIARVTGPPICKLHPWVASLVTDMIQLFQILSPDLSWLVCSVPSP